MGLLAMGVLAWVPVTPTVAAVFTADSSLQSYVDPRTASAYDLRFPGLDARQARGVGVVFTKFALHTPDPPPLEGSGSLENESRTQRTSAGFMINACLMLTTATAVWQSPRHAKPDPEIRVSVGPGTLSDKSELSKAKARVVAAPFLGKGKGTMPTRDDGVTPLHWEDNVAILQLERNLGALHGYTKVQPAATLDQREAHSLPSATFAYWTDHAAKFESWPEGQASWRLAGHPGCTLSSQQGGRYYTTDCSLIPGTAGAPVFAAIDDSRGRSEVAAVAMMMAEVIAPDAQRDGRKLRERLSEANHNVAIPIPEQINGQTLARIIKDNPCPNGGAPPVAPPPKVSSSLTLADFGSPPYFGALRGPDGQIEDCREETCIRHKFEQFTEMAWRFESLAAQPVPAPAARRDLRKVDDFYESRVGVLIHEECFGQYPFDVEQVAVEAVAQGFQCMMDASVGDTMYRSHIPRLVNLFDERNYSSPAHGLYGDLGEMQLEPEPCALNGFDDDFKSRVALHEDCRLIPEVQLGRPKIICQNDQAYIGAYGASRDLQPNTTKDFAYATGYESTDLAYVNYLGKSRIYNLPFIAFVERPSERRPPRGHFKATVWHELMHNLGYLHKHTGTPDYAFMCEVACFATEYDEAISQDLSDSAFQQCAQESSGFSTNGVFRDLIKVLNELRKY